MSDTYTQGFNDGYVIAGHLPDLARGISNVNVSSPWLDGFRDGRKQYVLEEIKELRPSWHPLNQDRDDQPDQALDPDRDEPDKDIEF